MYGRRKRPAHHHPDAKSPGRTNRRVSVPASHLVPVRSDPPSRRAGPRGEVTPRAFWRKLTGYQEKPNELAIDFPPLDLTALALAILNTPEPVFYDLNLDHRIRVPLFEAL